jgi:hypothetical protein
VSFQVSGVGYRVSGIGYPGSGIGMGAGLQTRFVRHGIVSDCWQRSYEHEHECRMPDTGYPIPDTDTDRNRARVNSYRIEADYGSTE